MLACTALAIILIYDQSPWLCSSLERFGNRWNSAFGISIMVERNVNFAALIIHSLAELSKCTSTTGVMQGTVITVISLQIVHRHSDN